MRARGSSNLDEERDTLLSHELEADPLLLGGVVVGLVRVFHIVDLAL